MTIARRLLVPENKEGLYHCISRCVRRAYLCGFDRLSGKDFSHRRQWIRERMRYLADIFAIDVASYAVQHNHLHVICRTRPDLRDRLSAEEVVRRWKKLYPGKRELDGEPIEPDPEAIAALAGDEERVAIWRRRLGNLGWYMKALKEPIARRSNKEDDCTGHFWEGRYKSQPLLDDAAVLAGLVYVDLNPIRARLASTPEESEFTGAHERIMARQAQRRLAALAVDEDASPARGRWIHKQVSQRDCDAWLSPIERVTGADAKVRKGVLPLSLDTYLSLLDWTGRCLHEGKSGAIPADLAPVLDRLEVDRAVWLETVERLGGWFHHAVGKAESLADAARRMGRRWLQGLGRSAQAFKSSAG